MVGLFLDGWNLTCSVVVLLRLVLDEAYCRQHCYKTKDSELLRSLFYVVQEGFEPPQTVPKTVVLPLHHWTNTWCFLKKRRKDSGFYLKEPNLFEIYFAIG